MGKVIKANRECTHKEAIILNAVSNMTDYDLKNFMYIMENGIDKIIGYNFINISKLDKENMDSYQYTLHTCTNNGLFQIQSNLMGESKEGDKYAPMYTGLFYVIIDVSYTLMDYMAEIKQLFNYNI